MAELKEVFEMVTKHTEPDLESWKEQEQRQRRATRNRRIGAFAVVAAIGLAAAVLILGTRPDESATTPVDEPSAVNPVDTTAEQVATSFVGAYGAFDAEAAITYLADDADVSGLIGSQGSGGAAGTREELPLFIALIEAQGYEQMLGSCEETGKVDSGTVVRCTFDFHNLGSDEIGRGPFRGSYSDLTVRDGKIVRASLTWGIAEFSPQMWEPFADWVSTAHPHDASVMYEDETHSGARLTEESIGLWGRRTREYVKGIVPIDVASTVRLSRVVEGVPFSFRLPASGWEPFGAISINKSIVGPQGAEAIIFWTSFPDGVDALPDDADPCADLLSPPAGPTAADLAAAVSTAPGTELVAGPSDVTVGGLPAKHVVLTVRDDVGCDPGYFYTWQDMWWGALWPTTGVGDTIRIWIVDVRGTLVFIEAETNEQADSDLEREIQRFVGSIRFE
jgi:hypothetical protein